VYGTAAVDSDEMSSGVIKSKAVSCPLVLKNWPSAKSDKHEGQSPSQPAERGTNSLPSLKPGFHSNAIACVACVA